jgi:RNA polymerase sigma factor (sigma-70 family)
MWGKNTFAGVSISAGMNHKEKAQRFEVSLSPHLDAAYNLALWLTRSPADAEDIVQESFLRAFSAFETLRGDQAKPWVLAIVRNTSLTWLKRSQSSHMSSEDNAYYVNTPEPSPGPEAQLLASCYRDQVRNALAQVPADFREAIVLRELEGLSYREIAAVAGVPLGTVMSRLSRGREWLKRLLIGSAAEAISR